MRVSSTVIHNLSRTLKPKHGPWKLRSITALSKFIQDPARSALANRTPYVNWNDDGSSSGCIHLRSYCRWYRLSPATPCQARASHYPAWLIQTDPWRSIGGALRPLQQMAEPLYLGSFIPESALQVRIRPCKCCISRQSH